VTHTRVREIAAKQAPSYTKNAKPTLTHTQEIIEPSAAPEAVIEADKASITTTIEGSEQVSSKTEPEVIAAENEKMIDEARGQRLTILPDYKKGTGTHTRKSAFFICNKTSSNDRQTEKSQEQDSINARGDWF